MAVQRQLASGQMSHPLVAFDHPPEGRALGDFLRQAREARGITLQQISRTTKIPQRHLDALEHGDLTAIPGGPYRRGEIRAYAKVVGLDASVALARLERAEHASPPPHPSARASAVPLLESRTRPLQLVAVVGGLALAIALVWTLVPRGVFDRVTLPQVAASAAVPSDAAPPPAAAAMPSHAATVRAPDAVAAPVAASAPLVAEGVAGADPETLTPPRFDGELIITSDPPGARVTVNGIGWGTTPVTIPHVTFGEKRIRLTSDGHAAEERLVLVSEEQPRRELAVSLRPVP